MQELIRGVEALVGEEYGRAAAEHGAAALRLHQYGQKKFMTEQGATVEEFRALFGKNYL